MSAMTSMRQTVAPLPVWTLQAASNVSVPLDMSSMMSFAHVKVSRVVNTRELKQRQRRRQRERHKFAYLGGKNNSFARPARAFFTFVHFFAVVSKTTTWNSQIWGFMDNVITKDKFSFSALNWAPFLPASFLRNYHTPVILKKLK